MAVKPDFLPLHEASPQILFQKVDETKAKVWFSPVECPITSSALDETCRVLFQRSHGAILVRVDGLDDGVLTIQQNPTIRSEIDLEAAAKQLVTPLYEACCVPED